MNFPDFQTNIFTDLKSKVSQLVNSGKPEQAFLYANLQDWQDSDTRKFMLTAQEYYKNDNDVKDRKRYYIDRLGIKQEAKNLSNAKLSHPTLRKLTHQKVNYLLSKELSIQCDDDTFAERLGEYFDKKFLKTLKNVGANAIVNGIAWVQVYYNEKGELSFKRIPSEEIVPFWRDAEHTELEAVIRSYTIIRFKEDGSKQEVTKVEYHTTQGVWYYEKGERGLIADPDKPSGVRGHFVLQVEQANKEGQPEMNTVEATWDRVPFIGFKYNADELSLLKLIKPLLDDYDLNTSDTSNHLQDSPDSVKIVKNYDGQDKAEFSQNLATYRTAFVSGDGDVTVLETRRDIATLDSHLNRLRKDLYEAGSAVDTQEVSLGNASGVALKFRYADLDSDMDDMSAEFASSLEDLVWFIRVDLLNSGKGDYLNTPFEIIFNTDSIINESEVITDAKNSVGIISDETILANHPWVTDAQSELKRMKKEREEKLKEMEDMMSMQAEEDGFGQEQSTTGEGEE